MSKLNKWKMINNSIVSTNDGMTAHDLINNSLKSATESIISPVVNSLAMKDEAKAEAEFNNLGMNIDKQRINRFNTYLNNKLEAIAVGAIEAGRKVEEQRIAIESDVIEAEVVEVKSFETVFAAKLGGELTINSNSNKTIEGANNSTEFDEFI